MRILVASPLGKVIAPTLIRELSDPVVTVAVDRREVQNAITATYRFDVVIADPVWNNPALEFSFGGLDVVNMLAARIGSRARTMYRRARPSAVRPHRTPRTTDPTARIPHCRTTIGNRSRIGR